MDIIERFELFLPAAILMTLIFLVSILAASIILRVISKIKFYSYKKRMSGMYKVHYMKDSDIMKDEMSKRMLPVIGRGYGNYLNDYMSAISEDRLPVCVVMNWVRSIAEDLANATLPIIRVEKWHNLMKNSNKTLFSNVDFIELEKYEECFIWGCVYRWLELNNNNVINKELANAITRCAYSKYYLKPYFDISQASFHSPNDFVSLKDDTIISVKESRDIMGKNIEIHGDLVLNKQVGNQVNGVATGGTGINVNRDK